MTNEHIQPLPKEKTTLPIWLLTTILITLVIGGVAGLLLQNVLSSHQFSLSGPGLISFVFTVALGAASIILAIITMILSRQAEDALVRRSDEGIRLQSDVFVRTNEVLSKIQASTGVTEKRIEDIISGRTNIIAQEVLEKSLHGRLELDGQTIEKLKEDLAASLRSELLPLVASEPRITLQRLEEMERKQEIKKGISEEWKEYRTAVVNAVQKASGGQLISETEGLFSADESEKFWDAIFDFNGTKVGFNIQIARQYSDVGGSYHNIFMTPQGRRRFWAKLSVRAIQDELAAVALVFNEDVTENKHFQKLLLMFQKMDSQFNTVLLIGSPEQIVQAVQKQEWVESNDMPNKALQAISVPTSSAVTEAP